MWIPRHSVEFFTITVDYDKTIVEMIAAGNYGSTGKNIQEKLSPARKTGVAEVDAALFKFYAYTDTREIFRLFRENNLGPANAPEILAFGAKYLNKQKDSPIVALGNESHIILWNKTVVIQDKLTTLRTLTVYESPPKKWKKWPGHFKFLAVNK